MLQSNRRYTNVPQLGRTSQRPVQSNRTGNTYGKNGISKGSMDQQFHSLVSRSGTNLNIARKTIQNSNGRSAGQNSSLGQQYRSRATSDIASTFKPESNRGDANGPLSSDLSNVEVAIADLLNSEWEGEANDNNGGNNDKNCNKTNHGCDVKSYNSEHCHSSEHSDSRRNNSTDHTIRQHETWYEGRVVDVIFDSRVSSVTSIEIFSPSSNESFNKQNEIGESSIPLNSISSPKKETSSRPKTLQSSTNEECKRTLLCQANALMVQLLAKSRLYRVSLSLVRLPPPKAVVELFVPRVNALAEVRLNEDGISCWKTCRIVGVSENHEIAEVAISCKNDTGNENETNYENIKTVSRRSLRRADFGIERRTLAEMGGIVKEVVEWPIENKNALLGVGTSEESQLDLIRKQTKLFQTQAEENGPSIKVAFIGQPCAVTRSLRLPQQFQERRERRLKLLEERREGYQEPRVVEFPVDEGFIGFIIGRQGEKLSRVAKDFQVELCVLPDDQGIRRVRVYGPSYQKINVAREELQLMYQEVAVDPESRKKLETEKAAVLKVICQRSGLHSVWLDGERNVLILWGSKRFLDNFCFLLEELLRHQKPTQLHAHHPPLSIPTMATNGLPSLSLKSYETDVPSPRSPSYSTLYTQRSHYNCPMPPQFHSIDTSSRTSRDPLITTAPNNCENKRRSVSRSHRRYFHSITIDNQNMSYSEQCNKIPLHDESQMVDMSENIFGNSVVPYLFLSTVSPGWQQKKQQPPFCRMNSSSAPSSCQVNDNKGFTDQQQHNRYHRNRRLGGGRRNH